MVRISLSVFLLFLTAWFGFGQATQKTNSPESEEQAVRQIMDQLAVALDHNDAEALDRLWAPDYIWVNPIGMMLTKAQRVELTRSGKMKVDSYTNDEENIRLYGTTAIDIYRSTVKGQYSGKDVLPRRRVTTVLLKRDGRWQVVSQQSTIIVE